MKKRLMVIPLLAGLLLAGPVFAQAEWEPEIHSWYFLFEIAGSIICIFAVVGLLRVSRLIGGAIGLLLTTLSVGMDFIMAALLSRSYFEWTGSATFRSDLSFEILIYAGLLIMWIGVEMAIRRVKRIKAS